MRCVLFPRSASSYRLSVGTIADLATYLETLQFWVTPARSPHEACRWRSGRGALVVAYHSGTVLVQGQGQADTHAQLRRLIDQSEVAA